MAIFVGDVGARQSTLVNSTTAVAVFKLVHSSATTWSLNAATQNFTVINTGSNPCYVGTSTSVTAATGFKLNAGDQLTVNGTIRQVAAAASGASPTTIVAGLATVSPVV